MSTIEITRHSGWSDKLRKWKIFLDGYEVGTIRQGEVFRSDVEPGDHQLWLKIDWASSQPVSFSIEPTQTLRFECRPGGRRLDLIRRNWNTWIDLQKSE
ncbi:MAG: hypothetical protein QOG04_1850 [Actinomycetota bacterium]|jgi:hypothetical protein|nr:hypothetical protein [Actinomycetota bacterium]